MLPRKLLIIHSEGIVLLNICNFVSEKARFGVIKVPGSLLSHQKCFIRNLHFVSISIDFRITFWILSTSQVLCIPTNMSNSKRTVLITGCSGGSLGEALAIAFHKAGLQVYATARDKSRMRQLQSLGIETLTLDVLSDSSIASCVSKISSLDILVNNAGAGYNMPVSDISIPEAKKLFDLNVWSYIAMTQAFLPLLLKSKGMIVNHTSVSSVAALPFQSTYCASKAAMAMFSKVQRLELEAFGITVVELKTGNVTSNFINKLRDAKVSLPKDSVYQPAREAVERSLRQDTFADAGLPAEQWAKGVVQDLLKKSSPPVIWRGEQAWLARFAAIMPFGMFDGTVKKLTELDIVERIIGKQLQN